MSTHPYQRLPSYTRWTRAVERVSYGEVDPVQSFPFRISAGDKVATAGSCFAQHIARHLAQAGFNYFVPESGHPLADKETQLKFNYGVYSARYGNLYTARQLLQTLERSLGLFNPGEEPWYHEGAVLDPFRPAIQPQGFSTVVEMLSDREQHLGHVRAVFEECDVFVFTMGLTELWYCRADGAALPVCPGVAGGTFDVSRYAFANQGFVEVMQDMLDFLKLFRTVNKHARVLLTVSPVPLAATAEKRHVLTSTVYSKSVLRAVAGALEEERGVAYFPSYEIITGGFNRGRYFANDLRTVTEEGVGHVMNLFFRHVADFSESPATAKPVAPEETDFVAQSLAVVETVCEENLIEASLTER